MSKMNGTDQTNLNSGNRQNMKIWYEQVKKENTAQIKELSRFASQIVKEHFDPLIGPAQNDYMIEMFQSEESIQGQLEQGYEYYFVNSQEGDRLGFLAYYRQDEEEMHLSKFYLHRDYRGQGISRKMLEFLLEKACAMGAAVIRLNVNRDNSAVFAYERLGFRKIREERTDIGHGFFMDDFVYEYRVDPAANRGRKERLEENR